MEETRAAERRSGVVRRLVPFALTVMTACSVGGDPMAATTAAAARPAPLAESETFPQSDVVRDLRLFVEAGEPYEEERNPYLRVFLVNTSATRSYPVVLPADGSEVGWREPHVWFTVDRSDGQAWAAAVPEELVRCGAFAQDWTRDVTTLAPGARVELEATSFVEWGALGDTSRLRVVAHYAYGAHARDKSKVPPALHSMPEFAIASGPVELAVDHPFALEVRVKGAVPGGGGALLSPVFEARVKNLAARALPIATTATGGQLAYEIELVHDDGQTEVRTLTVDDDDLGGDAPEDAIAPGATRLVMGPRAKTVSFWELAPADRVMRVRATLRIWTDQPERHPNVRFAASPWVAAPEPRPRF